MLMRAALCDDENVFRNEIYELLNEYARARHIDIVCDQYTDGRELLPCAEWRLQGKYGRLTMTA